RRRGTGNARSPRVRAQRAHVRHHAYAGALGADLWLPPLRRLESPRRLGACRRRAAGEPGDRSVEDAVIPRAAASEPVIEPVIRVSCVRHTYPDRTEVHLCGLDFVVESGQRAVILGPNGCGKSTLLYHILGLLEPQEGEVSVLGVNPAR